MATVFQSDSSFEAALTAVKNEIKMGRLIGREKQYRVEDLLDELERTEGMSQAKKTECRKQLKFWLAQVTAAAS